MRAFVDRLRVGEGETGQKYSYRLVGSAVADVHRVLVRACARKPTVLAWLLPEHPARELRLFVEGGRRRERFSLLVVVVRVICPVSAIGAGCWGGSCTGLGKRGYLWSATGG